MSGSLILTVTRACNLRCSYCPTAKDGWPSLTADQARRAVDLFVSRGGGDIKLFGGEPLLVPDVVRAVFDHASALPAIRRIYLSTNGLGLDAEWFERIRSTPKAILTISMDGRPEDHRRFRRALDGIPDTYDHIVKLLPEIIRTPRTVITMTIPPASAARMADNFQHLRSLGLARFNFLPGYYLPWRDEQLAALERGFEAIASDLREAWSGDQRVYVRNLFTWAPTPFFNSGMIVDADATIHPSNLGLSGKLDSLREQTQVGTLDDPPSPEALDAAQASVNALLQQTLAPGVWESTQAVDAALSRFCKGLYPDWAQYRKRRRGAA